MRPFSVRIFRRRRGVSLIYATIAIVAMVALASLAVDLGRVQVAKTQLQTAADAAARAGASSLATGVTAAIDDAAAVAASNTADGTSVVLDTTADIELGTWDAGTRSFTALTGIARSSATAVRVTARRVAARNTAVPLVLASVIGQRTCDIHATAIANRTAALGYGVIGLEYIKMGGNSSDAYWSTTGATDNTKGAIASNGDITLSGNSRIYGDACPGVGRQAFGATGRVMGAVRPLTAPLVFANGDAGDVRYNNDNWRVPASFINATSFKTPSNKTVSLPGGNYYFQDFEIGTNNVVTFTGPAVIYCYGTFKLSGQAVTSSSLPKNLKLVMIPNPSTGAAPGNITIGSGTALYATIYAPQSRIYLNGSGDIYGNVIGKSIDMTGGSAIHYDLALPGTQGSVSLVK